MSEAVISNIPRLYTAIAEWMACMVYISQCPKGLTGGEILSSVRCGAAATKPLVGRDRPAAPGVLDSLHGCCGRADVPVDPAVL